MDVETYLRHHQMIRSTGFLCNFDEIEPEMGRGPDTVHVKQALRCFSTPQSQFCLSIDNDNDRWLCLQMKKVPKRSNTINKALINTHHHGNLVNN